MSEIVQYGSVTKNESFKKVSDALRESGIENCNFMLKLYDEDLIGVDPHDPNLTDEQKVKIIQECDKNPWYYLREVLKVPTQGGGFERFKLDLSNCAQIYLAVEANESSWVCKPRQTRSTISSLALISYYTIYPLSNPKRSLGIYGRDKACSRTNINKLNGLYVPDYISSARQHACSTITYGRATVDCAQKDVLLLDDAEFIPNLSSITKAILNRTLEKAKNKDDYEFWTIALLNSVINDDSDAPDILKSCIVWMDRYYDKSIQELRLMCSRVRIELNGEGIFYIYNDYKSLGYDDKWFEDMSKVLVDPDVIRREILLKRKWEV